MLGHTIPALYGLLGYPLGHTLSPAIHDAALAALGVPGRYVALPVPPERLEAAVAGVRAFRFPGLNVTIPHKVAIVPFLDGLTPRAAAIGAVNTLYWEGERLLGDNTDMAGFLACLDGMTVKGGEVVMLGAGGAARAVAAGLREAGAAAVHVVARRPDAADALRTQLLAGLPGEALPADDAPGIEAVLGLARLVVNATPLGTHGDGCPLTAGQVARLPDDAVVVDLVYRPTETPLLHLARGRGLRGVDGLGMLVGQAAVALGLWTGLTPPVDVMRAAALAALEEGA